MAVKTSSGAARTDPKWYQRVEDGKQERDRHKSDWLKNRALLLGYRPQGVADWTAVNIGWAALETILGLVFSRVPDVIVSARNKPIYANAAYLMTEKINQDFRLAKLRNQSRKAILDVFWAGRGYILEKMLGDVTSLQHKYATDEDGKPLESQTLLNQTFVFQRLHPLSVIPDPSHMEIDMSDVDWLALDYYPTVQELKSSDYYQIPTKVLDSLPRLRMVPAEGSPYENSYGRSDSPKTEEDDNRARVLCREIWDRRTRTRLYMPACTSYVIGETDFPADLKYNRTSRLPLTAIGFNEHPDEGWPIPEVQMVAPQLEQFQLLFRTLVRDTVTKFRKFAMAGDLFEPGADNKLISGRGTSVIKTRGNRIGDPTKFDVSKMISAIQDPAQQRDVPAAMNLVKGLIHEILGIGDFAAGGYRSTRSATEAANLTDFIKVRMNNRVENTDYFHQEVSTTHGLMVQELMTEETAIQITDPQQGQMWVELNAKALQGDFNYSVVAGSSQPQNTETAKREYLDWYQITLPVVQATGGNIESMVRRAAPFFHFTQTDVDQMFSNHKQALMQLAMMFQAIHSGQQVEPDQILELIAHAVSTGLSPADIQMIMQQGGGGGGSQPKQRGIARQNRENQTY